LSKIEQASKKRNNQRRILDIFVELPAKTLVKYGITPNILSFCGFSCSIVVAILLSLNGLHFPVHIVWIVPFLMFWAGAFDVFDGEVARLTHKISSSGAFLDSTLDRLSDAVIILGLVIGGYINYIAGYTILFLIIMISYIRSRAENEGIALKGVGFMERAERLIILFFSFIVEFWVFFLSNLFFGAPFELFFPIFMIVFTGLLVLTIAQRLIFTFKELSKIETPDQN